MALLVWGIAWAGCGPLMPGDDALPMIDGHEFASRVEGAEGIVVVDFWAAWCAPCRKLTPILERLAGDYEGAIDMVRVDVDRNPELIQRFRVEAIPYLVLFENGEVRDALVGLREAEHLRQWFDRHLSS